jgi:hypothetical protein
VVHSKRLGLLDNPGPVPLSQLTDGQFRPSTILEAAKSNQLYLQTKEILQQGIF